MTEMGGSEHSGAVVKTKSTSGCLIIKKKAAYGVEGVLGFSDSSSRNLFNSNKERKRPRVVLSDSESGDELSDPLRRKVDTIHTESVAYKKDLVENKDFQTEKRVKNGLDILKFDECDERRIRKDVRQNEDQRESESGSTRMIVDNKRDLYSEMDDDEFNLPLSVSNETDEEDLDEPVRLQRINGVLKVMVNKHKPMAVSHRGNGDAEAGDWKESTTGVIGKRKLSLSHNIRDQREAKDRQGSRPRDANKKRLGDGTINTRIENANSVKGKKSKIKRASCTEKQLLREKIKNMLLGAGWTIDYRPRRNRDYLDSIYISPAGTAYWSITKAYDALLKEDKDSLKAGVEFTPLPNEILSKLTRQTRKKMEREMQKNRSHEGNSRKSKRARLKKSALQVAGDQHKKKLGSYMRQSRKSSESRLKEISQDSSDYGYSSDNSDKETPQKDGAEKRTVCNNSHIVNGRKNRKVGRRTLLGRGSDKGLNLENNGFVPYSGKRTLLSWLIDSGTVSVGEKVQYMNLRKTRVMQEGWITRDGIRCGCCSKIVTIIRFELHAGSKLGKPFQNIFVESGQSLMQCQIDAWNKQEESERKGFHAVDIDGDDPNDDTCCLCGDGGDLICCDGCPSTFHLSCLDMQMLPQGDWHCPNCACKYCEVVGGYCTKASDKTESSLLTCCLCEEKYHKSCSPEMDDKPVDSDDLDFSFCGQNCRELYCSLQKLLWIKHELDSGFSWSLIHRSDPLPDVSSVNFSQRAECNSKLAIAQLVMDECFLPIVDRRSGISLIHNVVYNCGSNFSRLNYSGFFTAILERGDEMICAASIRIHGTQLAEMPFIGTRDMYRRQGMCRRLLHAIESALSSIKVEKLVIPAIEEHLHTWTNAFGFNRLEDSCKQELSSVNMLVFPGTDMLQKPLMKQNITSVEGKKGVEVEDCNKSELKDTAMEDGNHSEPEIRLSGKKYDRQSDTNALKNVEDGNETAEGNAGADSSSMVETIDLQNDNETAIRITDANSLQSQVPDTISTDISHEPQLQVAAKDSVSTDEHSDSIPAQNGNVTGLPSPRSPPDIPLEPDLEFPGKESASIDVQSVSMEKEIDVQDATGVSDSIVAHCTRK
ncbi:uncharacterized protein LOC112500819 [Cynara cardunculus var. scolymus]|uniref:Acyl-CoA N-acyltransferase n=1 Tax=Cynara cardunculus var. scolymus TaxID=59895 RepID=A0A103Y2Y4_CYNCS|nr:uncharacterized protein LOC112500819 [Cynara cardunculus var. scolymus]KVI01554.1 Acyl-CoA N-acyltransferase [Cynara cardunculus var. scolymus]